MPTGYTAAVADGTITDLAPFAMQLARGLGALVTMRDSPHDAPIPERFEPSQYSRDAKIKAREEYARLRALTPEQLVVEAAAERAASDESRAKAEADHVVRRKRYLDMIAKVEAWIGAPEGIREFAIEQLKAGLDFDCSEPFKWWGNAVPDDDAEWLEDKISETERDLAYHIEAYRKDVERTNGRNAWLAQLRTSLTARTVQP